MPYIAIKSLPRDDEKKRERAEKINEVMIEVWGCPPQAVTISIEDIASDDWQEKVQKPEIDAHPEIMLIVSGKKTYE